MNISILKRILVWVFALSLSVSAQGAFIGLDQQFPDIYANFLTTHYVKASATEGDLRISGFPSTLSLDGVPANLKTINGAGKSYLIDIKLDPLHPANATGDLTVVGRVAALGIPAGTVLLQGSLLEFGFDDNPGSQILEFLFKTTGGALQDKFPEVGVILNAQGEVSEGAFSNSFIADYKNGYSDNFAVPLPSSLASGLVVLYGLAVYRSCRRVR
jgi:hypothetical protein